MPLAPHRAPHCVYAPQRAAIKKASIMLAFLRVRALTMLRCASVRTQRY
jgi:hypothetical protein